MFRIDRSIDAFAPNKEVPQPCPHAYSIATAKGHSYHAAQLFCNFGVHDQQRLQCILRHCQARILFQARLSRMTTEFYCRW